MPGKVKVKICSGKNLPVMDRSSDTTDAYVEIKLGNTTYKTDVCKKSLNPQWNTDWYRFELDDSELQDEPLQIRVMDHDTYSANDAIGKVYLNLNPLLLSYDSLSFNPSINGESTTHRELFGWIPVYDTMHGIRGEVNIIVKVELFSDLNRFRQSSCGVQFFYSSVVPEGFIAKTVHGFVEELVVNDDPEYQWIDKIRTPRATNEARQTLFLKLSGELQRKIGVKALNLGGNAVIGYKLSYDLEGESGIVARGIGTAVTLIKAFNTCINVTKDDNQEECKQVIQHNGINEPQITELQQRKESPEKTINLSSAHFTSHRRSSDSDLSITPRGSSLTGSDKSYGYLGGYYMRNNIHRSQIQENFDMLEYPFLTIFRYPHGFIRYVGGTVSARSVKRLETITNVDEPESRDTWWSELRMEIRSHARTLNCNAVLGYSEDASISDDICVLSAYGTAAVIDLHFSEEPEDNITLIKQKDALNVSIEKSTEKEQICTSSFKNFESPEHITNSSAINCLITHVTYDNNIIPLKTNTMKCFVCGNAKVPEVLICTIEPPDNIPSSGRGCVIESYLCRPLREQKGEALAKEVSDALPFLEYELHRLLINKLKIKSMNAIFGLKFNISIGEKCITCLATGTAVYLFSLPSPVAPKLVTNHVYYEKKLTNLQKHLNDTTKKNKQIYKIKENVQNAKNISDGENDDQVMSLDLSLNQKDTCILEIGDPEDEELLKLLMEDCIPEGISVVNTELIPGLTDHEIDSNIQLFIQVYRAKFHPSSGINEYFRRLLQSIYFKLRRMVPCAICKLQFRVSIPEADEIQLCVFGMALRMKKKQKKNKLIIGSRKADDDLIFKLDEEDHLSSSSTLTSETPSKMSKNDAKFIASKIEKTIPRGKYGVDITPLSYIPGGIIEKYLGNLNFFFIRETTSIREEGGPSGFVHSFVSEVLAILRAHVTALGGNGLIAYFFSEVILMHNVHKNQGQCLVNVGGDVVFVSYSS